MALTKISTAMWNSVPHHDTQDFNVDDAFYVDVSAGKIGIGTTSPTTSLQIYNTSNAYLNITGGANSDAGIQLYADRNWAIQNDGNASLGTADYFHIYDGTAGASRLVISTSGNIGIGTTSPATELDIKGSLIVDGGVGVSSAGVLHVRQSGDGSSNGIAITSSSATSHRIWKSANGNLNIGPTSLSSAFVQTLSGNVGIGTTSPRTEINAVTSTGAIVTLENSSTALSSGNSLGKLNFYSNDISSSASGVKASINAEVESAFAATSLTFSTAGYLESSASERMRITSGGDVLINNTNTALYSATTGSGYLLEDGVMTIARETTASTQPLLVLNDTGVDGKVISFRRDGAEKISFSTISSSLVINTGGGEKMRIDSSGKVGIGTTPYASTLGNFTSIDLGQSASMWGYLNSVYLNSNAYFNDGWKYKNNDSAGVFQINGNALNYRQAASGTAGSAITLTEVFTINSTGNVGIGTASPTVSLNIQATNAAMASDGIMLLQANSAATNNGGQITFGTTSSRHAAIAGRQESTGGTAGYLQFGTRASTGDITERMRITSSGNVGIGTTGPATKLHVAGQVRGSYSDTLGWLDADVHDYSAPNNIYYWIRIGNINSGNGNTNLIVKILASGDNNYPRTNEFTVSAHKYGSGVSLSIFRTSGNSKIGYAVIDANLDVWVKVGLAWAHTFLVKPIKIDGGATFNDNYTGISNRTSVQPTGTPVIASNGGVRVSDTNLSTITHDYRYQNFYSDGNLALQISGENSTFYTNSTERMRINSSGNVGIGTTSPDALLDIGVNNIITLDDTGNSTGFIGMGSYNDGTKNRAQAASYYGFGLEIDRPNQLISFNSYDSTGLTTSGTNILVLNRLGKIGIGTATPSEKLHVVGNIKATGDVVAYSSSDERFKDNKKNIENALKKVESLNGVEFDWNDKQDVYEGHDIGIIAQEVEKIVPEIVNTRDNGYKAVKYEKLVPLLIESIKELSAKIEQLQNKNCNCNCNCKN